MDRGGIGPIGRGRARDAKELAAVTVARRVRGGDGKGVLVVHQVKNFFKFTATGIVAGLLIGWLLSLVSGNISVVLGVGTLGLLVGSVLGIVHRHDP